MNETRPSVLFVCVHNAGRSQMAAAWLTHLAGQAIDVRSAGTLPAEEINPRAVQAMREVGVDLTGQKPALLDTGAVQASDYVITMGCGDTCPVFPGKTYRDWQLPDPAGADLDTVRSIRDAIRARVQDLIAEITSADRLVTRR